ncbi:MAG: hypothetical protein IT305_25750 [Chloroflexi bacterium]|nr:hypothetical protein [Chloroflexota bacterium]
MTDLPRQVLLDGQDEAPPLRTPLRAGPLTMILENGDLRYVRYGDKEIVRRIYVAVRDRNWRTPPLRVTGLSVEQQERAFRIRYLGEFRWRDVDFAAGVTIAGEEDGTVTFALDGEARSTFVRNRIGICFLHPGDSVAGTPFLARKVDGTATLAVFPRTISPHQPVQDLGTLVHDVVPGLVASIRFEGDTFEMEDQRNWTDASFKTYSTPLRLPRPVTVEAGTRVRQSVTLTLVETGADADELTPPGFWPPPLEVTLDAEAPAIGRLPSLGLGADAGGDQLGARERARLIALGLAHLRVDLHLNDPDLGIRLRRGVERAAELGVPIEAAIFLTPDDLDDQIERVDRILRAQRPSVRRWLVFDAATSATASEARLGRARTILRAYAPEAAFVSGTDANFTELNRGRPPVHLLDAVCYTITPQVHAFDNTSLVETLQAQAWTVECARARSGGLPVVVSPVTLRPRFNAVAESTEPAPEIGDRTSPIDVRQMSLLGAGWTLGSIASLAKAGAESVTYYETIGARGVLEATTGSLDPDRFHSVPGGAFPLYHVLADVLEYADADILSVTPGDPLTVAGLALRQGDQVRLLLANLTPYEQQVTVRGLPSPVAIRLLDEHTALAAMREPEAFRSDPGHHRDAPNGCLDLELLPYAVARLDSTLGENGGHGGEDGEEEDESSHSSTTFAVRS